MREWRGEEKGKGEEAERSGEEEGKGGKGPFHPIQVYSQLLTLASQSPTSALNVEK